jgi:ATP synthase protein I
VTEQRDQRPPLAVAMEWASRATTIALEMAVPGLVGYWIDWRLGTGLHIFLVLGVIVGFVTGLMSLISLARSSTSDKKHID